MIWVEVKYGLGSKLICNPTSGFEARFKFETIVISALFGGLRDFTSFSTETTVETVYPLVWSTRLQSSPLPLRESPRPTAGLLKKETEFHTTSKTEIETKIGPSQGASFSTLQMPVPRSFDPTLTLHSSLSLMSPHHLSSSSPFFSSMPQSLSLTEVSPFLSISHR